MPAEDDDEVEMAQPQPHPELQGVATTASGTADARMDSSPYISATASSGDGPANAMPAPGLLEADSSDEPATRGDPNLATPERLRKRKRRIVWAVIGAAVLAGVAGGTFIVYPRAASQNDTSTIRGPQQRAAVASVTQYNDAWQNVDCDAYTASTTEDFRTRSGLTDCSEFETKAEAYAATVKNYKVAVNTVQKQSGVIRITTTETYSALVDEDGARLSEPVPDSIRWVYVLVPDRDHWVIDDVH
jgi:hypothetical protein